MRSPVLRVSLSAKCHVFPSNCLHPRTATPTNPEPINTSHSQQLGYAKSFPHDLGYGPQSLGGIGLRTFYDEQGSTKVELVLKHFCSTTLVNSQLHIALAWCQRVCGISQPILEFPGIALPHLETPFFPSLRKYLHSTNAALMLEQTHVTPLQRIGDFHLLSA